MINGHGRGREAEKCDRGRGIAAVETGTEQDYVDEAANRRCCGGRNGVRFGRGGYRTWLLKAQKGAQATLSLEVIGLILLLFVLLRPKHMED